MIKNVVIPAAGSGFRMGYIPKILLKLNGETIAERTIRLLREEGLTDITFLVCNNQYVHHKEMIEAHLKGKGVKIRAIDFPTEYTDNMWTVFKKSLDLFSNTLLLLGDCIFSRDTLQEILKEEFEDIMFITSDKHYSLKKNLWHQECFGFIVNEKGTSLLHNIPNPFKARWSKAHLEVRKQHNIKFQAGWQFDGDIEICRWEKHRIGTFMRGAIIVADKKRFIPKGFIFDIDFPEDYEIAKNFIKNELGGNL